MFVDERGFVEYVTVSYKPTTASPDLDAGRFLAEQVSDWPTAVLLAVRVKERWKRTHLRLIAVPGTVPRPV